MGLLLKRALDAACVWHATQLRKYPGAQVPYASHVAGVAATLAAHGFDEEVVAAGALHDVIEDCGVTAEELTARFGPRVAELVVHVSEADKAKTWEERKREYLARFPEKPWSAQAITVADKIDNFRSIVVAREAYGDPWAMFKRGKAAQLARFEELAEMLRALPAHPILDEFAEALEAVRRVPEG